MLAPMELPSSATAAAVASTKRAAPPRAARIARFSRSVGSEKSALRVKSPGNTSAALTTTPVSAPLHRRRAPSRAPETTRSQPRMRSASPARDADGVDVLRRARELDVAEHRAALLREARHVDHAAALAFEMRGHAEDRADRDDAGAADAGDDDRIGRVASARGRAGSGDGRRRRPRPCAPCAASRRAR